MRFCETENKFNEKYVLLESFLNIHSINFMFIHHIMHKQSPIHWYILYYKLITYRKRWILFKRMFRAAKTFRCKCIKFKFNDKDRSTIQTILAMYEKFYSNFNANFSLILSTNRMNCIKIALLHCSKIQFWIQAL